MTQSPKLRMKQCIHPECRKRVRASRQYRLCETHRHAPNLCTCHACSMRDEAEKLRNDREARARAKHRPGIRQVTVAPIGIGGMSFTPTNVSLPAEPWEQHP